MKMDEIKGQVPSRTCYLNGWKRVRLADEEVEAVEETARRRDIEMMKQCFEDTFEIEKSAVFDLGLRTGIAIALFEARRMHRYTLLKDALDTKVFAMKKKAKEEQEREMMQAAQVPQVKHEAVQRSTR